VQLSAHPSPQEEENEEENEKHGPTFIMQQYNINSPSYPHPKVAWLHAQ